MNNDIYIRSDETTYIPSDYLFSHNLCVRFYSEIEVLLQELEDRRIPQIKLDSTGKKPNLNKLGNDTGAMLNWLRENGYEKQVRNILSRQILSRLVHDMQQSLHTALYCSKNARMTTAYTNLRKPLLETLFMLEQIFCDENTFMDKFEESPSKVKLEGVRDDDKKALMIKCIQKMKVAGLPMDGELLFDLRYNKTAQHGLFGITNQSIHLVTDRHKNFTTEKQNFNFIFSVTEDVLNQYHHFYLILPPILNYIVEIVTHLVKRKIRLLKVDVGYHRFFRFLGMVFNSTPLLDSSTDAKIWDSLENSIGIQKCPNCGKENKIHKADWFQLYEYDIVLCKHCLSHLLSTQEELLPITKGFEK